MKITQKGFKANADRYGLPAAIFIQRNIPLPLKAPLDIPVCFTMADKIYGRTGNQLYSYASLFNVRSGASGFFMPTT